ncbi:MAG: histidinol-phosphate transaminase [Burkholderiaceae bacterium]|nr:histidinol-phosphate transaminase [Burkholderiaceae bacterium]
MDSPSALAPEYVRGIAPYQGGRPISEIAREFGFQESEIVKLASNENPLGMSPKAREAMMVAAADLGRYPDGNGFDLKAAISKRFSVPDSWITLGNGSNDILELVAHAFLQPERESVYSQHSFAVYALATQATGAKAVVVPATAGLGHDLSAMRRAVNARTGVVWVANPNNPTGTFIAAKEIEAFIADIPHHVLVVLDEAYTEYLAEEDRYNAFEWVAKYPNLLVSRSFSKAYGLAGLRIGFGISQPAITDLLNRIRQPFNVNSLAQAAACAALFDQDFLAQSQRVNREGMVQLERAMTALGLSFIPSWGNFLLVKMGSAPDAGMQVFKALLAKGVITRPVANYELPQWLRISIGTSAENERFIAAMEQVMPALRSGLNAAAGRS